MANNYLSNKDIEILISGEEPIGAGLTGPTGSICISTDIPGIYLQTIGGSSGGWLSLNSESGGGAAVSFPWKFKETTSSADPGTGQFRLNGATASLITEIYVNDTTSNGIDASNLLNILDTGTKIYLQQNDDATRALLFSVSGTPTDNTGWFTIPVTYLQGSILPKKDKICGFILTNPNNGPTVGATNGLSLDGDDIALGGTLGAGTIISQNGTSRDTLALVDTNHQIEINGGSSQQQINIFKTGDVTVPAGKFPGYNYNNIRIGVHSNFPDDTYYVAGTGASGSYYSANFPSPNVSFIASEFTVSSYSPDSESTSYINQTPSGFYIDSSQMVGGTSTKVAGSGYIEITDSLGPKLGMKEVDATNNNIQLLMTSLDEGVRLENGVLNTGGTLYAEKHILQLTGLVADAEVTDFYELKLNGINRGVGATVGTQYGIYQADDVSNNIFVGSMKMSNRIQHDGIVTTLGSFSPGIESASVWKVGTTASAAVMSLPDGVGGQQLTVYMNFDGGGDATITPVTTPANYSSFRFSATGESVDLIWDDTIGWVIKGSSLGTVVNP